MTYKINNKGWYWPEEIVKSYINKINTIEKCKLWQLKFTPGEMFVALWLKYRK